MKRKIVSLSMCFVLVLIFCCSNITNVFAASKTLTVRGILHDTGGYIYPTPQMSADVDSLSDSTSYSFTGYDGSILVYDAGTTSYFYIRANFGATYSTTANSKTYYVIYPSVSNGSWTYSNATTGSLPSNLDVDYYPATTVTGTIKSYDGSVNSNVGEVVFYNAMASAEFRTRSTSTPGNTGCANWTNPATVSSGVFSYLLPTSVSTLVRSTGTMGTRNGFYEYVETTVAPTYSSPTITLQTTIHYATYTIKAMDSASNTGIQGIVYSTTNPVTGTKVTSTTNINGEATFSLPWKTGGTSAYYTFVEDSMPSGYGKSGINITKYNSQATAPSQTYNGTRTSMSISHTATYTYNELLENTGSGNGSAITVSMKDSSTAEPVNGATFTVKDSSGSIVSTLVTNAIGEAAYTGAKPGTYTVTQTGTGADYNFTTSSQSVTVDSSGVYVYFTNARKTGSITFYIKDSAGAAISGAKFILSGNGTNTQYTTNSTGAIALTGIRYGPYVLTEHDIPSGYVPKNLYVEFTLNNSTNGTSYTYNYNKVTAPTTYGDITINLYDSSTGVGIKGGTFQVKNSSNTVVSTVVTNAIGSVTVSNLPVGTYTVTQTASALYYTNEAATNTVTLTTYGGSASFTNARQTGTLSIYLKDTTGTKYVSGAQFILSGGGTLNTQTSSGAGLLTFSGVRLGEEYHLSEYVIPSGYVPRNLSVPITMTASTANYTYNYSEVSLGSGNLIINLYDDATGVGIKGGAFQVKNSAGTIVTTVTTNAIGTVSIDNLTVGTYTVTQVATGNYYANSGGTNSVNLAINGTSTNFTNSRLTGTTYIYVKDITGSKNIANSQFLLTGNGTNNLQTANSLGLITFTDVRQGEPYQLVEYYIPSGYIGKNMTVSLTLTSSSASYTYNYAVSDDWRMPAIEFASLPADNEVDQYYWILTLTDNQSGVKELRIDGMSVFVQPTSEALSVSYTQEIYMNGTYKYELIDYAGNIYTTTKTVKCIANSPLYINSMTLSNYKSKVDYDDELVYVVNSSYPYSNVNFSISDEDADDAWTYRIEIMTLSSSVLYTNSGSLNRVGNNTARVQYQNETSGSRLDDGIYIVTLTVGDGKILVSESCKVIVKNSYPPKPIIIFTDSLETVSIQYPTDLFEGYSSKEYCYLDGLFTYTNSFNATENGMVTATYTDIAGNKTSTALYVSIPRKLEDGESGTPLPSINDNDSSITGIVIDEDNNFIVYYIGIRSARGKNPEAINELLNIVR